MIPISLLIITVVERKKWPFNNPHYVILNLAIGGDWDGALGIDIDRTTEASLTLTDPAFNTLKLKVTPNGTDGPFLSTGENYETFPAEFSLHGNYPNPFNPVTTLRYSLSNRANVTVSVYNLMGQQIFDLVNRYHDAGFHQVTWSGKDNVGNTVPSGVYFYRVTTKDESLTGKMLLMK